MKISPVRLVDFRESANFVTMANQTAVSFLQRSSITNQSKYCYTIFTITLETVTLRLPQTIYRRVKSQAMQKHRSIEDELVAVVTDALPALDTASNDLGQLTFLTDEDLWQTAKKTFSQAETERMQELVWQRQEKGLTDDEQQEIETLLSRYRQTMLVRAKSAVLLKERGHDISMFLQTPDTLE